MLLGKIGGAVILLALISLQTQLTSAFYRNRGALALASGQTQTGADRNTTLNKAVDDFHLAQKSLADNPEIERLIGLAYFAQQREAEALAHFSQAEMLGSRSATANLAYLYLQRKEWTKAIDKFAAGSCPEYFCIDAYVTKLFLNNQAIDAIALLNAYIARFPTTTGTPYYRLFGQYAGNQPDEVLRDLLKKGLSADPEKDSLPYRYYSAQLAALESNNQEAIRILEETVRANPEYYSALHFLGQLYLKTAEPQKAITVLKKALQVDAKREWSHYYLASAYLRLQHNSDAIDELWQALLIAPTNKLFLDKLIATYQQSQMLCFAEELLHTRDSSQNTIQLDFSKEKLRITQKCQ